MTCGSTLGAVTLALSLKDVGGLEVQPSFVAERQTHDQVWDLHRLAKVANARILECYVAVRANCGSNAHKRFPKDVRMLIKLFIFALHAKMAARAEKLARMLQGIDEPWKYCYHCC